MPTDAPVALAVLAVTALLSFDPENARTRHTEYRPDAVDLTAAFADGGASQGVAADEQTDEGAAVEYEPDRNAPRGVTRENLRPPRPGRRYERNRVVQGRMLTPESLAELVEGERPMDAEPIQDADFDCPECGENVIQVGYMPSVTEFVTAYKCQECDWADDDRDE